MRIDIKEESKEYRMLERLQKVFQTKNATDTFRLALEKAFEVVRVEELMKAGASQAKRSYDDEMTEAQGLTDDISV